MLLAPISIATFWLSALFSALGLFVLLWRGGTCLLRFLLFPHSGQEDPEVGQRPVCFNR